MISLYLRFVCRVGVVVFLCAIIGGSVIPAFAHEDAKCGTMLAFQHALKQPPGIQFECGQPSLPLTFISKNKHFTIHYDVQGIHAVPSGDIDGNSIPDYVDSCAYYFEYAYDIETGELGYPAAPTDNLGGEPQPYDIYLWNIAKVPVKGFDKVYGVTFPCESLSGGATIRYKTWIVIDNDFSPNDSSDKQRIYNTFGYDAVKITSAHEYHHAIQIGNYGFANSNLAPYETTSTWIEERLYPDILDYVTYLRGFFENVPDKRFGWGEQQAGYGNVLFYMFLEKTYGANVIRRMWEKVANGTNIFRALDSALIEKGTDLNAAWCLFMPYMYYTGERARPAEYFPKSAIYPMLKMSSQEYFSEPSLLRTGIVRAFEMQLTRCIFRKSNPSISPDTADFIITNPNKEVAFLQNDLWRNLEFVISRENLPNPLPGTPYSWSISPTELCAPVFFSTGVNTVSLDYVYPDPFRPDNNDVALFFPIPVATPFAAKIALSVYTPDWKNIYTGDLIVESDRDKKVIRWQPSANELTSGVYIYTLGYSGEVIAKGKFSVLRH